MNNIIIKIIYEISKLFSKQSRKKIVDMISNTLKDKKDDRDYIFQGKTTQTKGVILKNLPKIRSQGSIGSCASHAAIGSYEIQLSKEQFLEGSELYHYYNARKYVNNSYPDPAGMTIRDACKTLKTYGFAFEHLWPYDLDKFNDKPAGLAYTFSKLYKIKSYERLEKLDSIKASLIEGIPILCGIYVNDAFKKFNSWNYTYKPTSKTGSGHAVLIIGYDDSKGVLVFRNSWGKDWGNNGYFEMPYSNFEKYSFDWWRILSAR